MTTLGIHGDDARAFAPPGASDVGVIALAGSAGGLEALGGVLEALPRGLGAAVVALLHMAPHRRSALPDILAQRTQLEVERATHGEDLRPGAVFVAQPGAHLLVGANRTLMLDDASPVHHVRPAADRLFASLAEGTAGRVAAVVLSGTGVDGAAGVRAIKAAGGTVIAQDEATSRHFGMPEAAIATGDVDLVLPLGEIPGALIALVERWQAR